MKLLPPQHYDVLYREYPASKRFVSCCERLLQDRTDSKTASALDILRLMQTFQQDLDHASRLLGKSDFKFFVRYLLDIDENVDLTTKSHFLLSMFFQQNRPVYCLDNAFCEASENLSPLPLEAYKLPFATIFLTSPEAPPSFQGVYVSMFAFDDSGTTQYESHLSFIIGESLSTSEVHPYVIRINDTEYYGKKAEDHLRKMTDNLDVRDAALHAISLVRAFITFQYERELNWTDATRQEAFSGMSKKERQRAQKNYTFADIRYLLETKNSLKITKSSTTRAPHAVSGHWRNQAYGPGNTLRKRIWVDGFRKGDDISTTPRLPVYCKSRPNG